MASVEPFTWKLKFTVPSSYICSQLNNRLAAFFCANISIAWREEHLAGLAAIGSRSGRYAQLLLSSANAWLTSRPSGPLRSPRGFFQIGDSPSVRGRLTVMSSHTGNKHPMRCWKCDGTLSAETAIDLHSGLSVQVFLCMSCGRRWHGGENPRLVIAA